MVRKHHVLFSRRTQESQEPTKCLRRNYWLMPPMEDEPHVALHQAISTVPVLDPHTAMRVHKTFEPVHEDYIATVYKLVRTIDEAIRHPRCTDLERGLGNLAMMALEMQVPFIKEGLVLDYGSSRNNR